MTGRIEFFGAGQENVWVIRLDTEGAVQWQKTFGATESDFATAIRRAFDGGYSSQEAWSPSAPARVISGL